MADAVLGAVLSQLVSIVQAEVELVSDVKEHVRDLEDSLNMVGAALKDAERKQVTSDAVKLWLQGLNHIMYDADDVVDEWLTRIELSKSKRCSVQEAKLDKKVRFYLSSACSCFKTVVLRHKIVVRIRDVTERLNKHKQSGREFNLVADLTKEDYHKPPKFTSSSSIVNPLEIKGRDSDKQVIVGKLFAESSTSTQASVLVVSIVGMGGWGKTALAQLIYNDEKVRAAFELKMWVCVSQPFDRERLAKEIIEQASGKMPSVIGWEALHMLLSKAVEGKRFLLVLDDVWTENYEDWRPLKLSLDRGAPGSRVLVTTRNVKVSNIIGSSLGNTHSLGLLADDDCWSLFRHVAFSNPSEEHVHEFEEFKGEILQKCKGVPLTTNALGGLMRSKQTKQQWRDVLSSHVWKQAQDLRGGFFPAILLSYQDLPSHLKQCFMYTAIFPKDTRLIKEELVQLWMAQGFLGLDGSEELEIIGEGCFDELAMRSFFQDFQKDVPVDIFKMHDLVCKMHDLVHDFAQSLTNTECSILEDRSADLISENVRHVNAIYSGDGMYKGKKVRTLMCPRTSEPDLSRMFDRLKCVRTLDLSYSKIEELPEAVGRLLHLRYLDLSYNYDLKELPETVGNLCNLQILKLNRCWKLCDLPHGIGELSNLRHLELEHNPRLERIPKSIGKLSRLRTLSKFVVDERGTIEVLGSLNHLRGSLKIYRLCRVENEEEARRAQLLEKKKLRSLTLHSLNEEDPLRMESVLEGLQPHKNLEILRIYSYQGSNFPQWMSICESSLPNIVELELVSFLNCSQLPPTLGKLKHLDTLSIHNFPLVKDLSGQLLGVSNAGGNGASTSSSSSENVLFPVLKTLSLKYMKEWEEEMEELTCASVMPCLQSLEIIYCPKLKVVPHYMFSPSLQKLDLRDCMQLTEGMQPYLPLQLEALELHMDLGVFSRSLPLISSTQNNNYSSLKSVRLWESPHTSLPQGLNHFTSLQHLYINNCKFIDLKPEEELSHFPMLRKVEIHYCPRVRERYIREDWSTNLSNIPYTMNIRQED